MYGMNKSDLRLMPHDPAWVDDFAAEKTRIESAVENIFLTIEHIGSTSIPTVCAKPILDLAILCQPENLKRLIENLTGIGYEFRGEFDEKCEHYYAVLDKENIRYCQAHIYTEANEDWRLKLKFRDALSQNIKLAREYNDYKQDLAQRVSNKKEYAEIKSKWVDTFVLKVLKKN